MEFDKILEDLAKKINFNKYDAFSREKKCHYIKYKGVEYAFLWQTVKPDDMKKYLEDLEKLKGRIDAAKEMGARLPAILSIYHDKNHVFQLQEKVNGKKFGAIELLDEKTRVEDFIELLITFDAMSLNNIKIDNGKNCFIDDEGHINLFDCVNDDQKPQAEHNARPELFKRLVFPEPQYYTEEQIPVLTRILEKWITACAKYFYGRCEMYKEIIYDEIDLTIKNYSFISRDEKKKMINDILDKTLQKSK